MTRRRWFLVGLGVAALVWILGAEWVSTTHGIQENHLLDAMVGIAFVGAGIVALDRRPANLIGPLMILFGTITYIPNWSNLGLPVFPTLVLIANSIAAAFLVHVVLAYPNGRVERRFDRFVLGMVYGTMGGAVAIAVLAFPRRPPGCPCPWTPLFFPNARMFDAATSFGDHLAFLLVPLVFAAVILRWRHASRAERKALTPLWVAASVIAIAYLISAFGSAEPTDGFSYLMFELRGLLQLTVPVIFLWGLLSTRLARSAVGDLVVELEGPMAPGGLRLAMARALGDPTLDIAYAIDGEDRWIDAEGRAVPHPVPADGRAVTPISREDRGLAALLHDPALDAGLVHAAGVAAGMAVDNERLRAEVRAQLEEVRNSRQRIVEAGDRERRRVERNLHDGAQQRLVTLSLALAMLQERPETDPEMAAGLAEALEELRAAIGELRDLARGIHPAILTEEGLAAAVESLADRSSIPVHVTAGLDGRAPEPVEATAYFVVAESLANASKYSRASGAQVDLSRSNGFLRVEVSDDGVGDADPRRGSGLRGLEDRVSALGGTLRVESPPGVGTRVLAEIPVRVPGGSADGAR
jgi:signal transduction histidine kinase